MNGLALWLAGAGLAAAGAGAVPRWHAAELGHGQQAVWTMPQILIYRDSASFRSAWGQLFPAAVSRPALPAVDFAKWRVILIAAGTKPTGGYYLTLASGQLVRDSAVVTVTVHTPAPDCGVTEALTSPAVAIAMPIVPAPFRIVFHERADSARCN
ncbi:MAG: protease complex subunit PrcB family protein [Gemmatimonadales bacterium]